MRSINRGNFIIIICILGTILIVPFVYTPIVSFYDFFYFPKYIALVLITCCLLMVLLKKPNSIKELIQFDWINKLLLMYFVLITISLLFSLDPMLSIKGNFLRYDGYSTQLMYIILFLFARTINSIDKRFVYAVSISSAILASYGILQYIGVEFFIRDSIRFNWKSAFSTFGNQNFFGSYLVLQIPFSLYSIINYKRKWAYLTYSITLLALLMTMTRSSWIGFILSFILLFNYFNKKNNQYQTIVVLTILIIICFNILNNGILFNRFMTLINDTKVLSMNSYSGNTDQIESLGSFRIFIWIRVIEMIKMRPLFGFGIENLALVFEKYYFNDIVNFMGSYFIIDKAHNDFLHIAVSTGIPSLIVYITFISAIFYKVLNRINQDINILLFASITGYVICLFFNISVVSVAYIFWIYLGLLCRYNI